MNSPIFRPAARTNTKPLIGLYGQSGCGKTYSSLLLARGFVGPNGKIAMIDTESGRGELYADVIPGGYSVMQIVEPFSPKAYIAAIKAAEAANVDALVIDSVSHEWEGLGGVTDMAADKERASGKPGLHCWKEPKMEHQRFVLKLMQTPLLVIVCMRAKFKSRQVKNERTGKNEIVKDDYTTPIQAEDFIYECTVHAEIMRDHTMNVTKHSHPSLKSVFVSGKPATMEMGKQLAAWANGGANAAPKPATEPPAENKEPSPPSETVDAETGEVTETLDVHPMIMVAEGIAKEQGSEALRTWYARQSRDVKAIITADPNVWEAIKIEATTTDRLQFGIDAQ